MLDLFLLNLLPKVQIEGQHHINRTSQEYSTSWKTSNERFIDFYSVGLERKYTRDPIDTEAYSAGTVVSFSTGNHRKHSLI